MVRTDKRLLNGMLAFLVWFAPVAPPEAAGFDCAKARTPVETTICRTPRLGELDESMSTLYPAILDEIDDRAALIVDQRAWLGDVRDRCSDAACLLAAYTERLHFLQQYSKAHPRDPTCGLAAPASPKPRCPARVLCRENRNGSLIQAVADQCTDAAVHDIEVYFFTDRQARPRLLTTLRDQEFRDFGLDERDPRGYAQLDILVFCGAGPNCVHELYRFDPHDRALYHYFSGGYSELYYSDGYLIESGRASCCSWELHAYKVRQVGAREQVDRRSLVISFNVGGDDDAKPDECRVSGARGGKHGEPRLFMPGSAIWRRFCR